MDLARVSRRTGARRLCGPPCIASGVNSATARQGSAPDPDAMAGGGPVIVQVSRPVVLVLVARLVTQVVTAVELPVTVLAGRGVPGRLAS